MSEKGDKLACRTCGVEILCLEGCGCKNTRIVCCGKKMTKKVKKKAKKKVKK